MRTSPYMNIYARQSFFVADGLYVYFKPDLWKEHTNRVQIYGDISSALYEGSTIQEKTVESLHSHQVTIAAPRDIVDFFWGWKEKCLIHTLRLQSRI
jgi:hypothetical protein